MTTMFAYEIFPGVSSKLFFAFTLDECRAAVKEQRAELRTDPEYDGPTAMPIYELRVGLPDIKTVLEVLNDNVDLASAIIIERKLIETVSD